MNCKYKIKINSVRFFGNKPAYFCLIQKSKHPMLIANEECKNCSKFQKSDKINEYSEEESDSRFGIWDFLGPNETFKYQRKK